MIKSLFFFLLFWQRNKALKFFVFIDMKEMLSKLIICNEQMNIYIYKSKMVQLHFFFTLLWLDLKISYVIIVIVNKIGVRNGEGTRNHENHSPLICGPFKHWHKMSITLNNIWLFTTSLVMRQ